LRSGAGSLRHGPSIAQRPRPARSSRSDNSRKGAGIGTIPIMCAFARRIQPVDATLALSGQRSIIG